VSLPRPLARIALIGVVLAGLLAAGAGIASAHVTVSSPDASRGGFGKVVFRVPDESDTASTVKLRIQLPPKTPFASVSVLPVPGWTVTQTRTAVNPPLKDDDGNSITDAVSVVEFDAAAGGGIAPGQFQEFALSVGPFPDADSLAFSVVQNYSDGTSSAWIEPTVEGQAEPEHPAPVLTLAAASSDAAPAAESSSATHDHGTATTDTSSAPVSLALFFAILALVVALAGVVLAWRAFRRTVSS
jgi:periplasmic copper chaperone A